jgi:8-oxo-dGTP pyrophosphatase MutT (NUDIX family)
MRIYQRERFIDILRYEPSNPEIYDKVIFSEKFRQSVEWWKSFERDHSIRAIAVVDPESPDYPGKIGIGQNRQLLSVSPMFDDFIKLFRFVPASGGLVKNKFGQWLFIYRLGCWDLPKGKIDRKDMISCDIETSIIRAAKREIGEETGVRKLTWLRELPSTWHLFNKRDTWILKETFWHEFLAYGSETPIPQVEEGITDIQWINTFELAEVRSDTYPSLQQLIEYVY